MPSIMDIEIDYDQLSSAEELALMPLDEREKILASLSDEAVYALENDWRFWARPEQMLPDHDEWDVLFWMAGRGSGKTRPSAETVNLWAENEDWHIAIVGETAAEVRDVMVEGPSGILATAKPWNPARYEPSKRRVVWPETGTWATTYSGDKPDQLRGPNSHKAWVDEIAKFRYPDDTWHNLEMVLRAGNHPQVVVSSTPRPIPLIKQFITESLETLSRTIVRTWSTFRNVANLAPTFINRMRERYHGTRLGRQELYAEILSDVPGALWSQDLLSKTRVHHYPEIKRIVVGVDPAGSTLTETGIVVVAVGQDGHGYVLDDMSIASTPGGWGAQVVMAFDKYKADRIAVEANNGGDMCISTIETAAKDLGIKVATKKLHASRGKYARAEPVAALYEQGRMHHVGMFADCEDELTTWVPNEGMESPNRLDALVWAATEAMLTGKDVPVLGPTGGTQTSRWRI